MAVVALTSARRAPGVTTTAIGLTLVWPRPVVLVEADVSGSSSVAAGYLGGAVAPDRGLINFAVDYHAGALAAESIRSQCVPLVADHSRTYIPALTSAEQADSMTPTVWSQLGHILGELGRAGTDVIVDAGRAGMIGGAEPLLPSAQVLLLVTRSDLDSVAAARARVGRLQTLMGASRGGPDSVGLLLVGEGRPFTAAQIAKAVGLPVVATISHDPANAAAFTHNANRGRRLGKSALMRSLRTAAAELYRVGELQQPDVEQSGDTDPAPPAWAAGEGASVDAS